MLSCSAILVTIYIITFGFTIVAPLVISCEAKMDEGCYDANEMQKVKILLIFSGTKSRAVTSCPSSCPTCFFSIKNDVVFFPILFPAKIARGETLLKTAPETAVLIEYGRISKDRKSVV